MKFRDGGFWHPHSLFFPRDTGALNGMCELSATAPSGSFEKCFEVGDIDTTTQVEILNN